VNNSPFRLSVLFLVAICHLLSLACGRKKASVASRAVAVLLGLSTCLAASTRVPDLKALYDGHRWFALRDALDRTTPVFYRGAVACGFNDLHDCEKTLRSITRSKPRSEEATEARGLLLSLYHRAGRFGQALAEIDALLAAYPDNGSLKRARGLFGALGQYPDQSVARRQRSTIPYRMKGGNLFVPVSIRGHPASYIVDTGADFSLMSESEARRLGLAIHEGGASVTDITGGTMGVRTTVVDQLQVGATILRHIAFLVVGDDQQPFVDLAPDERGVLGIPVLLALEAFRWTADGAFEIDVPTARRDRREANVCFDGATPVTEGLVGDRRITMLVDTGAVGTQLWPTFAGEFAALLSQSGAAGTKRVTGVGHSVDVESITLPEVRLRIGGFDTVLRPANVLVSHTLPAGQRDHGNLGMDLLGQARSVTIDFRSMMLVLK
jgi:predicted aspartyl protease